MSRLYPDLDRNRDLHPLYGNVFLQTETDTKHASTLEIRGFNPNTHIDTIILYFENTKRSGGDEVIDHTRNSDVIYITYKSEEIAKRVCSRQHIVDKTTLNVRQCRQPQASQASGDQGAEKVTLQSLIEQRERDSARGSQKTNRREPTAPFEEEDRTSDDQFNEDTNFNASDPPSYSSMPPSYQETTCISVFEDKIFVEDLNPDMTQECLFNFLGAKTDATPLQIVYNWDETSVVVSFSERLGSIETLKQFCKIRTLENHHLKVTRVPVTNCVIVKNTDEATTKDTVRYYMENNIRSGGGEVTSIEYNEDEDGWLVHFKEYKAVNNVCKKAHKLEGKNITVRIFYPCLGSPQFQSKSEIRQAKVAIKIPNPYLVPENHKVEFIKNDAALKQKFENDLETLHAKVHWAESPEKRATVCCTLTVGTPDSRLLVKRWADDIETAVKNNLDTLAEETFAVDKETWTIVKTLDESKLFEQDELLLIENKDGVVIVCKKEKLVHVSQKLQRMLQEAKKIRHRALNEKKKTIQIKRHQIQLLLLSGFEKTISEKFKDLDLILDPDNLEVTAIGLEKDIQSMQLLLYETMQNIKCLNAGKVSKEMSDFLKLRKVKKYLLEEMEKANLLIWFEINGSIELVLYTISKLPDVDTCLQRSADLIKKLVSHVTIAINDLPESLLSSQKWHDEKKDVENIAPGLVMITEDITSGNITLLTIQNYAPFCRERMDKFFESNTIHEKRIDASAAEIDLAKRYKSEEIEDRMNRAQVQVQYEPAAIKIKGTRDGIAHVEAVLNTNLMCVKRTQTYKNAVWIKYLKSTEGKLFRPIESAKRCVIKLDKEPLPQKRTSVHTDIDNSLETMSCVLPSGQKISIRDGAIFDLDVDVMVCTTNKDLKLVGGLGKAIADKVGPSIQYECDDHIKKSGSLREGQLRVLPGGRNLMCKYIVFVVGPMYTGKRNLGEETVLKDLVLKSLTECERRNMYSVVFPAICTGYNRFPVPEATRIITLAIQTYFQNNLRSCVKKAYLCDTDKKKIQSFERALESVFGVANCTREKHLEHTSKRENSCTTLYSRSHHLASRTWSSDGKENKIGDFVNVTIGKLELKIFHGDISCAKTDVIVIGARQDMDLSKGLLSNKVRKKGGHVIQQELNSQRDLMKSKGMVVTTSGNLPCTYLIHVDITEIELPAQWKTKFDNLLKKTEELQMPSLAIPAFGIHDEEGAAPMAQGLFQALYEHKNPRVLQEVHMVIFEADVKRLFLEEIQKCLRLKDSTPKRFFRQLSRRMLVPFSDQHRSPISEETLTITVHSESDKNNTEAIKMLDEEIKKSMSTNLFENTIIKELSPSQQNSILSIPEYICVEVTLNIKSGKIKLVGCQVDVKKAQEDVERVIRQAERNKKDLALFAPKPQQM